MQEYVARRLETRIREALRTFPAVGLIGARQCGKSTLARRIVDSTPGAVYLDLELDSDARKLSDAEAFFNVDPRRLICLDEIQRAPELFRVLRGTIDRRGTNGQFLILGSASPELLRQTSESLAGRLEYLELTPFVVPEVMTGRPTRGEGCG